MRREISLVVDGQEIRMTPNAFDDYDLHIKYHKPPNGMPPHYIPEVNYFHGEFTCNFSYIGAMGIKAPEETALVIEGIHIAERIIAATQAELQKIEIEQ